MRRLGIGAAAAFVAVASVVFGGALPALAASVPPAVIETCEAPTDRGGWNFRDTAAVGTYHEDPAEVRGRTVRMAEPCFATGSFSIPIQTTDIPADMLDADDDGQDDGGPEPTVGEEWEPACAGASPTTCIVPTSVSGVTTWKPSSVWHTLRWICGYYPNHATKPAGTNFRITMPYDSRSSTTLNVPAAGTYNIPSGYIFVSDGTGSALGGSGGAYTPSTPRSCPAGTEWYIEFGVNDQGGTNPTGTTWAPALLPTAIMLVDGSNVGTGGAQEAAFEPGTGYYGGTQEAPVVLAPAPGATYGGAVVNPGTWSSFVECAESYEGPVTDQYMLTPTLLEDGGAGQTPPHLEDGVATAWTVLDLSTFTAIKPLGSDPYVGGTVDAADCAFLNRVVLVTCTWAERHPSSYACQETEWTADRWRTHNAYQGTEGEPPGNLLCYIYPDLPGCYDVLNPPYVDGTDFSVVCADPPEAAWLDFGWLPAVIGHYAECLFVPVNGWDRDGEVADAVATSSAGDLGTMISEVYVGLGSAVGTCGAIVDVDLVGTPLVIDTCSWGWAPPLRSVLVFGVLALGGFAVASFALRTVQSLRGGEAPDPLGGGK